MLKAEDRFSLARVLEMARGSFLDARVPTSARTSARALGTEERESFGGNYSTVKSAQRLSATLSIRPRGRVQIVDMWLGSILVCEDIRAGFAKLHTFGKIIKGMDTANSQAEADRVFAKAKAARNKADKCVYENLRPDSKWEKIFQAKGVHKPVGTGNVTTNDELLISVRAVLDPRARSLAGFVDRIDPFAHRTFQSEFAARLKNLPGWRLQ
jgi:hypothetical protein